jgi:GntR family transcriptional regulator/MocR family aminotransferase
MQDDQEDRGVHLAQAGGPPIYVQIYEQMRAAIEQGEFRIGERMPSEREIQRRFHVSRMTAQSAYRKLEDMGYVLRHATQGTFVAARPQWPSAVRKEARFTPSKSWRQLGGHFLEDLMESGAHAYRFDFEVGRPDMDLFPNASMQLLLEDLLTRKPSEVLMYSATAGLPALREAIARRLLPQRGMDHLGVEHVLVTTGAMQAIDLIAKLFLEPDDLVVVERPTFPGAIQRFRAQGARFAEVPVDGDGLDVERLEHILRDLHPRLVYLQPCAQNPTGATLSADRRQALLALARDYNVPIVEDDAGGFFADGAGARSLQSEDQDGLVLHVGTFSKLIAPGLRVGYIVAPANIVRLLTAVKQMTDLHTGPIPQLLLEGWLMASDVGEHVAFARRVYAERLRAALAELEGGPLQPVLRPRSGMYIFCRIQSGLPAITLQQRSAEHGVVFAPGDEFSPGGELGDHLRLCVSGLSVASIRVGLQRLRQLLREISPEA